MACYSNLGHQLKGLPTMPGKNPTRKVKDSKSSRLGEVIHILNTSIEDSFAEEMLSAEKGARRKKTSLVKQTPRR
jgi:hypothetical protein